MPDKVKRLTISRTRQLPSMGLVMVDVLTLSNDKLNEWNDFVEHTFPTSLYHFWEWGETLSSIYGYKKYCFAAIQDGKMIGVLPMIHVKSRLFGNRLISLPFCEYGGPILFPKLNSQEREQTIAALLRTVSETALALGVSYIEMRKPLTENVEKLLKTQGYTSLLRYVTFRIDLTQSPDELWANLHKTTRKAVRKALKNKVTVAEVKEEGQLKAYYRLYLKDIKRHGSPPHKYAVFSDLFGSLQKRSRMRALLAEHRGKLIGGRIVFCDGKSIFCWNSVSDQRYRSLNPSNLLLWEVIEWGHRNHYNRIELGRTRKQSTVYDFKKGWGGEEIPLNEYIYFMHPHKAELPDPTQTTYRYASKVWSLIPTSLAKMIGPRILSGIAL